MSVLTTLGIGLDVFALAALLGRQAEAIVAALLDASAIAAAGSFPDPGKILIRVRVGVLRRWHGGGGDDTKRGLRRIARRFTPARRTAPTAG